MGAPLLFIDETFGTEFSLEGPSMPEPPITFGVSPIRKVTRYGGRNQTSVQILGEEYPGIELVGQWRDKDLGQGEAQRLRRELESLASAGSLIRLEYGDDQRWGILDVEFEERRDNWIDWRASLEVLYAEPPELNQAPPEAPPNDLGTIAELSIGEVRAVIDAAPPNLISSVLTAATLGVLQAQNRLTSALKPLRDVESYAQLAADVASAVSSTVLRAGRRLESVRQTMQSIAADDASINTAGVDAEEVGLWRDNMNAALNTAIAELIALARALLEAVAPSSGRAHTVTAGETIQAIARRYYGDVSRWVLIADANDLDTTDLEPGQSLRIPDQRRGFQ